MTKSGHKIAVLVNIKDFHVATYGNLIYLAISLSSNAIFSYVQQVVLLYILYSYAMYRSVLTSIKTICVFIHFIEYSVSDFKQQFRSIQGD